MDNIIQENQNMLPNRSHRRGFTLIELLVTISVMAILASIVAPNLSDWVTSARVRSAAESLQNGLRLTQSEAMSRSQVAVFSLTNDVNPTWNSAPAVNGANWFIHMQPTANSVEAEGTPTSTTHPFVQSNTYASQARVTITGPALICLNSLGRVSSNYGGTIPNANSQTCSASSNQAPATYTLTSNTGNPATNKYQVVVYPSGKVRMCDANKTLSDANPDGC